jgi:transcriptional regulator with XRE-family HTH domain
MANTFRFSTDFGGIIRKERKKQKLSMKELAVRVNMSEQAISQYERGTRKLKQEIASKISEALNYPIMELLDKYGHRYAYLAEWSGWEEEMWRELFQRPMPIPKRGETTTKDILRYALEEMGYFIRIYDGGERACYIKFPDGYEIEIETYEFEDFAEKSAEYINMLLTQRRYDEESE